MIEGGIAGGSALQQASQRRATADRLTAEARWLEALAADEQAMALRLASLPEAYAVLHDLRLPGSKGNIDHVVIGPGGAFVVLTKRCADKVEFRDGQLWAGDQALTDVFTTARVESQLLTQSLLTPVVPLVALLDTRLPAATPSSVDGVLVCGDDVAVRVLTRASHTLLPPHMVSEVAERALPLLHNAGTVPRAESSKGLGAKSARQEAQTGRRMASVVEPAESPANDASTTKAKDGVGRGPKVTTGGTRSAFFVAAALATLCVLAVLVGGLISFAWRDDGDAPSGQPAPEQSSAGQSSQDGVASTSPLGSSGQALTAPVVEFSATCPVPGGGWSMRPVWPGDLDGLARYEIETQRLDASWDPLPPLEAAEAEWSALAGQPAGAAYTMRVTAVMADGGRSPNQPTVINSPSTSC